MRVFIIIIAIILVQRETIESRLGCGKIAGACNGSAARVCRIRASLHDGGVAAEALVAGSREGAGQLESGLRAQPENVVRGVRPIFVVEAQLGLLHHSSKMQLLDGLILHHLVLAFSMLSVIEGSVLQG